MTPTQESLPFARIHHMRIMLEEDLAGCTSLEEVQHQTQATLRGLREDGYSIHYVAGPISCDGEEKISENIENLLRARTKVMKALGQKTLVFTAPYIFSLDPNHNSYARLGLFQMPREEREANLREFWRVLISSGLIGGITFLEGSERSPGANDERVAANLADVPTTDISL